ncbi:MAG: Ig-like domain-containing protein [Chloroflexota bacterium]
MLTSALASALNLSRFDRLVGLTLLGLTVVIGLLLWRGDRVGAQVIAATPPDGATEVSTRSTIQVIFDQPMVGQSESNPISFNPPVSGTIRWDGPQLRFTPSSPLAPDTTYRVELAGALQNEQGRSLKGELSWQFTTARPRLLYLAPAENAIEQLYMIKPGGSQPAPLTEEPFGVFDYAVSPDGTTIVYAALREDAGSDLWSITVAGGERKPLLACPGAVCNGAVWAPDSSRLVYERRTLLAAGAAPAPPRLWWLNPATGETAPIFEDTQIIGYGAGWSADGQWLSYVAPASQGVQIYNVSDGRSVLIPSRMGQLAVWSPVENKLLLTDIQAREEGFALHLLLAIPEGGELVDLSGEDQYVEDSSPDWSPDGEWIVFTRKAAGAAMGKQVWLMRADGRQARYLTTQPEIHYGLPRWSPAGQSLVFQSFPLKELGARPTLWLLDVQSERSQPLIPGSRATWLP